MDKQKGICILISIFPIYCIKDKKEMKHLKQDRRVNKTKNAITNTLLTLKEEKPVSRITVSELTEAADINRKTFYNHYSNIDSVLSEMEDNCINWAVAFVKDMSIDDLINDPATVYVEIARGLQRHSDFIMLLNKSGVYPRLSNKIAVNIKSTVLEKAESGLKPEYLPKAGLLLDFITAGAVGVYDNMFRPVDPVTLEEATTFFYDIYERSTIRNLLREDMLK